MNLPTRVVVADDHGVVAEALRVMLDAQPDMEVLAVAATGFEAQRLVCELRPDIVLATSAHMHVLQEALARWQAGGAVESPAGNGHCVMLDAVPVLSRFMVDGRLDEELFRGVVTSLIAQLVPAGGRRVWVFGELVGLLVEAGKLAEALRLEVCWGELVRANRQYSFAAVCSYPQHALERDASRHAIAAICRAHTGVSLPR